MLLGGTNDYRGIIDPQGNFTGWHLSVDGGRSVANEGLLPPVQVAGQAIPSGGDPVFVTGRRCSLYGASLNYGSGALGETPSAVGVYRSHIKTALSCPQGNSNGRTGPAPQQRHRGPLAARDPSSPTRPRPAPPGRAFIGDYLEVTANRGRAWVHYNANERHLALLGEGLPIPQQDNYLTRLREQRSAHRTATSASDACRSSGGPGGSPRPRAA